MEVGWGGFKHKGSFVTFKKMLLLGDFTHLSGDEDFLTLMGSLCLSWLHRT